MQIRDLKKGAYFTFRPIEEPQEKQVWVRGDYDRSMKKYSVYKFSDTNWEIFVKGNKECYIDFTF